MSEALDLGKEERKEGLCQLGLEKKRREETKNEWMLSRGDHKDKEMVQILLSEAKNDTTGR